MPLSRESANLAQHCIRRSLKLIRDLATCRDGNSTTSIEEGEITDEYDTTSTTFTTPPTTFSTFATPLKQSYSILAAGGLPDSPPDPDALLAELEKCTDPAFHRTMEVLRRGSHWPSVSFAELDRHSPVYSEEHAACQWKPALDGGSLGAKWVETPASKHLLGSFGDDDHGLASSNIIAEPMTSPWKLRKGISGDRRTEQIQPDSHEVSPPTMSIDELLSEEYVSEAAELGMPRFPEEDTFVLCAPRNKRDDETEFSFTLDPEQYARTQLWASRKNGPVNVDGALCISLGCYRQSTFIELMNLGTHIWKDLNNLTNRMTCEWPTEPAYVQALLPSKCTNIPICLPGFDIVVRVDPSLRTPEGCIDITEHARAGVNNLTIVKQGPVESRDDFLLIVHAHRPTELQLQQLGKRARVHSGFARLMTDIRTQYSTIPAEYLAL
ncbi:hypothetical protein CONPUDRAFT_150253 [Coniophora puteana RWD-64-598 SS2]|uniref:Uncharacterized protein n=1 Tax=Coniophora puteana (strain RWD-64-598) TaxID=741705 RepID=A0A5M3N228_CONPW|nr:uncharacterized protein CONPUDRAFT_150253 [Coniophora puteana RWD-64-598 SS2]EIW85442.1 hypothetical protein CONPUDRAFT_150253 [Coniophora puteana RWD-64-598 SS2]